MNLKLEITGAKPFTPQQREAIQQKLVEIKDIAKRAEAANQLNDTQNKAQCLFCKQDSEKAISTVQSEALPLLSHRLESKNIGLANILRQEYKSLDMVVQMLLRREKGRLHQCKIGSVSLESCFLHQTANLLYILSAHLIPHLEQLYDNKNQHS